MINKKSGGGVGFVIMVVALVIVMLLAAKAWNAALPAVQALKPGAPGSVPDHGQTDAGDAIRSGKLPNLRQMNQNTDQHIEQMKEGAKGQD